MFVECEQVVLSLAADELELYGARAAALGLKGDGVQLLEGGVAVGAHAEDLVLGDARALGHHVRQQEEPAYLGRNAEFAQARQRCRRAVDIRA